MVEPSTHVCKNCGHPVKTSREMGDYRRGSEKEVWHWIDGWGTKYCPEHCGCENPEIQSSEGTTK